MNLVQSIAPILATHALNSLVLGLAISILVWVFLWAIVRHNSAARFAVLYSALLAILGLLFWQFPSHSSSFTPYRVTAFTVSASWAVYLLYGWAIVALFGMVRIAFGLLKLRDLRRSFIPLDVPEMRSVIDQSAKHSKRSVRFYHSPRIRVPGAVGFFRPAVVLPSWSLRELSPEALKTAVLHELAHVDRWDDWTNLAQKIIRALLFFHPAVWWLDSRLTIEREISCDDAVLAQSSSPENYAQCLVSLAEKSFLQRQITLAQAAVGHVKQTALRVGRILNGRKRSSTSVWKPAVAALAAFSALATISSNHIPQLVAFQSASSPDVTAVNPHGSTSGSVIPAAMHVQVSARQAIARRFTPSSAIKAVARRPAYQTEPQPYLALARPARAFVINASSGETSQPKFMYVVMQTRDYDGFGRVQVITSVWKVRLMTPAPIHAQSALPPHST